MSEPKTLIEQVDDAAEIDRVRAQVQRGRQNSEWLASHWADLLPNARGRFVAVAGQEAFVADTAEEAWGRAKGTHPNDDGAFVQYVIPTVGPRVYANRCLLASV